MYEKLKKDISSLRLLIAKSFKRNKIKPEGESVTITSFTPRSVGVPNEIQEPVIDKPILRSDPHS